MATKKRRTKKRTSHRKSPVKRRKTTVTVSNPRRRRSSSRRRPRHNPGIRGPIAIARRHHRRRRSNPGGDFSPSNLKKLGMAAAIAAIGGFAGAAATAALESRVSQPPRTLGLIKLALAAAGMAVGAHLKQPLAGVAFAGAVGASGAKDLVGSFTAPPSAVPAVGAGAGTAGAMPQNAGDGSGGDSSMQAVMDDDYDSDDMDGAEGMAAVFDGDETEDGSFGDSDHDFENQQFDQDFIDG